jgi:hypothetical protein
MTAEIGYNSQAAFGDGRAEERSGRAREAQNTKRTQDSRASWLFQPRSAQTSPSVAGGGGRQGEGERALTAR